MTRVVELYYLFCLQYKGEDLEALQCKQNKRCKEKGQKPTGMLLTNLEVLLFTLLSDMLKAGNS